MTTYRNLPVYLLLLVLGGGCTDDDAPGDVVLANFDTAGGCESPSYVFPLLPDEAGHLAAVRLTSDSDPVTVTAIAYDLFSGPKTGPQCDATLGHRLELYVTDAAAPASEPSADSLLMRTLSVSADATAGDHRNVSLTLDEPIELAVGQHLFVAVELAGNESTTSSLCIEACSDGGGISGVNYWSNATAEPYAWADMIDDFGFQADFTIRALGI